MKRFIILLFIYVLSAKSQTLVETYKPEINTSFTFKRITKQSTISAEISNQSFTYNEGYSGYVNFESDSFNYTGTSSNIIYNRLKINMLRKFNDHWYGTITFQKQNGRYFFYNNKRSFSSGGVSLGHKGSIDELFFYKELGINVSNQFPKSIKDIYLVARFDYVIKNKSKDVAIASLSAKVDWLGTTFDPKTDPVFALRNSDESFVKKMDQSWFMFNIDFIVTEKMLLSTHINYFTEYYPISAPQYDAYNLKHYIIGLGWKYHFGTKNLTSKNLFY